MKKARIFAASVAAVMVLTAGPASAGQGPGDDQGFCKKQGSSSCNGNSECAGPHIDRLPNGQAKKC